MGEVLHVLLWVTTVLLLLGGVDDIFMDIVYLVRKKRYTDHSYDIEFVKTQEEKPIAIIIGAWREFRVIERTITFALNNLEYENYRIFVGIYPNDDKSISILERLSRKENKVIPCINTKDGPTTKADNLNNIYECIKRYERENDINFEVMVVHDSEDFIHGFSLKLYNYLIVHDKYDAVQIPVYPKKDEKGKMIHRTYCDAFAELHTKDMILRQVFNTFIPFAGTGMAFSKGIFNYLEDNYPNLFNEHNLTEDYELGLRLHKLGYNVLFMNTPECNNCKHMVVTSEFFPNNFWAAVRQRSRWIAGICFQNWKIHKWDGSKKVKYFLYRDRKGIFNHFISTLAYFILVMFIAYEFLWVFFDYELFDSVVIPGTVLWYMLVCCMFLMANRFIHRFIFTKKWYGKKYALKSLLRVFVDNFINFFATIRAVKVFHQTKKKVVWDATEHY
jgi:bacteriophage N4 adsorption protein B